MKVKMGQEYWDLMKKTAAKVEAWPDWKKGISSRQKCCERDTDGDGNCPVHNAPGVFRIDAYRRQNHTIMTKERRKIVYRLREEGAQAAREGKSPQSNPHRYMDAFQWRRGYDYEILMPDESKRPLRRST